MHDTEIWQMSVINGKETIMETGALPMKAKYSDASQIFHSL